MLYTIQTILTVTAVTAAAVADIQAQVHFQTNTAQEQQNVLFQVAIITLQKAATQTAAHTIQINAAIAIAI